MSRQAFTHLNTISRIFEESISGFRKTYYLVYARAKIFCSDCDITMKRYKIIIANYDDSYSQALNAL